MFRTPQILLLTLTLFAWQSISSITYARAQALSLAETNLSLEQLSPQLPSAQILGGWTHADRWSRDPFRARELDGRGARQLAANELDRLDDGVAMDECDNAIDSNELIAAISEIQAENAMLKRKMRQTLQRAEEGLTLRESNESLTRRVYELESELTQVSRALEESHAEQPTAWFVHGVGAVLLGTLLGLLLPLTRRQRSNWRDL